TLSANRFDSDARQHRSAKHRAVRRRSLRENTRRALAIGPCWSRCTTCSRAGVALTLAQEVLPCWEDSSRCAESRPRRALAESHLGPKLGEARVGADGVGHWLDVQVDETVDSFLVGELEQAEGLIGFSQRDMDSRRVQAGNESGTAQLLQFQKCATGFSRIACKGLGITIGHKHHGSVAGELPRPLEGFYGLRVHLFLGVRGAEPELRGHIAWMQLHDLQRLFNRRVI